MEHIATVAGCSATVEPAGPLDLAASVAGFERWGDDLMDRWDGRVLRRVLPTAVGPVAVACEATGGIGAPRLRITVDEPAHLAEAQAAVLDTLVTAPVAFARLCRRDQVIGELDRRRPGIRPVLHRDVFAGLVRSISAQQVNLRWAATTRSRLALAFGERLQVAGVEVWRLDPARLAAVEVAEIRALQFTTRKAEYLVAAAAAVAGGDLHLDALRREDDETVIELVTRIRGMGRWSAEWLLARTLGRPRVVAGDLGVRKAVGRAYAGGGLPPEAEVRRLTAHWGEAAGVAQQLLLHALVAGDLG